MILRSRGLPSPRSVLPVRLPVPLALLWVLLFACLAVPGARAQNDYKKFFDEDNLPPVRELLKAGRYDVCERVCEVAIAREQPSSEWRVLLLRAMARQGRVAEAMDQAKEILETEHGKNLGVIMEAYELAGQLGERDLAQQLLERVNAVALESVDIERPVSDRVALGRAALGLGADPATVIERYFKAASKQDETYLPAYLAAGELALNKGDYARASKEFQTGLKFAPKDPDLRFGLARAFYGSDREKALESNDRVLEENPSHVGALLLKVEALIDSEQYGAANELLDIALGVDGGHPGAWGFKAALAELSRHDQEAFREARAKSLERWAENPEPDHITGRVLSRNYRFAEGAAAQRRALAFDSAYLPAKIQLTYDLLRLGEEEEAWELARQVAEADPYHVLAFNLTVLEGVMAEFFTYEDQDFTMRMPEQEFAVYGEQALGLLRDAKEVLCEKYGLELEKPVLVEFFPERQDFAIRTLGNLGGQGILGACFGSVVTMNSPGGLAAARNNWEATLWHEFCHVVTLSVTENRMPRWLSEGISVYEEILRNPAWGEHMTPSYRRMILDDDDLTPISELSGAFLAPETSEHLMFAYYQSNLVVAYLIDRFGIEAFRGILRDLGEGMLINEAIAKHTEPIEALEAAFTAHARSLAENYGPEVDWTEPTPAEQVALRSTDALAAYLRKQPASFWARQRYTAQLLGEERWDRAIASADELIELLPEYADGGNGYAAKAQALRALKRYDEESEVLRVLASKSAEALMAYDRLRELDHKAGRWEETRLNANRMLAIDPFAKDAHFSRARAYEADGLVEEAASSYHRHLALGPGNPSETRFRLARVLSPKDPEAAKRHLLDALADAPRFREAHHLLLTMKGEIPASSEKASDTEEATSDAEAEAEPEATPAGEPAVPPPGVKSDVDPKATREEDA